MCDLIISVYTVGLYDPHHLLTNNRTVVCKDSIEGIDKNAWVTVAEKYPEVIFKTLVCDKLFVE